MQLRHFFDPPVPTDAEIIARARRDLDTYARWHRAGSIASVVLGLGIILVLFYMVWGFQKIIQLAPAQGPVMQGLVLGVIFGLMAIQFAHKGASLIAIRLNPTWHEKRLLIKYHDALQQLARSDSAE